MRQALAMALQDYEAAVVLVSHDRHLLRAVADELILVDQGRAVPFDGDLDDYAKWFTTREEAETAEEPSSTALSAEQKKQRKREEAERRNRLSPLKAEIARLEKQLERLEKERATIETALAAPEIYNPASKQKLQELLQKQAQLKRDISNIETEWLTATEKLDAEMSS
jgi:ATP-binding cassette subfamily F protein 3